MLKFKRIIVKNGLSFKTLDFTITDYAGLNLILGKNCIEIGSNGSGKSSIFELLKYIIYNTAQITKDAIINYSASDGFYGEVYFEKDGIDYKVWSSRKHSEYGSNAGLINLSKNKTIQTGLRDTFPALNKLLSYSPDEFSCLTYLDQKSIHPFITRSAAGTNEIRRNILSNIYRLFYKQYLQEAKDRGKDIIDRSLVLKAKIESNNEILEVIPEVNRDKIEKEKEHIKSNIEKYSKTAESLSIVLNKILEKKKLQERYDEYCCKLSLMDNVNQDEIKKLRDLKNKLDIDIVQLRHEELKTARQEQIENEIGNINDTLKQYSFDSDFNIEIAQNKLLELQNKYSVLLENKNSVEKLEKLEKPKRKRKEITEEYNVLKAKNLAVEKAILTKKLRLLQQGSCPECERAFENAENQIKLIEKQLSKINNDISIYNALEIEKTLADKWWEIKKSIDDAIDINNFSTELKSTLDKVNKYSKYIKDYEKALSLKNNLTKLKSQQEKYIERNELDKHGIELKQNHKKISNELLEKEETFEKRTKIQAKIDEIYSYINEIDIDENYDNIKHEYDAVIDKLDTLKENYGNLSSKLDECERAENLIKKNIELKKELVEINKKALMYDVLKYLFGPDQFAKKIQRLIDGLNAKLSEYIAILFPDEFSQGFKVEMYADGKEIQFRSSRKNRDITKLSGGEEQRIIIAFMLALREFIPQNKMTNLLIIDEYDSHIDSRHKEFVLDALNYYSKKYPETCIFVITQDNSAQNIPIWNNVITVEKQSDGDSLIV